jgi:hypothetical protein
MQLGQVNWMAVGAAALSTFVLGGLWYSPALFGRAWQRAAGVTQADVERTSALRVFGLSFLFALAMAFNLAMFLAAPGTTPGWGATAGLLAGFGWVTLAIAVIALFERRSWSYIAINGGYMTVAFVIMGLILGSWR